MDVLNDLLRQIRDLERQVRALQRQEVSLSSLNAVAYSGTPTAGRLAQWTGAGTIEQTTYAGSVVALVDAANTFATNQTFNSYIHAVGGLRSFAATIADDNVASFTMAAGMALIANNNDGTASGIVQYRSAATVHCAAVAAGSNFNVTTGALTGTTGTDGKVTVSAHSDGKLYIENRRGSSLIFTVTLILGA